ncbi:MAG: hypothetical protein PHF83_02245 [Candidatus Methanomethylophilus sp.]|nr:hypothetical protein [Methanomethylophilus sp.]MDD4668552.1 hypothetical protein [Methanomethylophilus sp.]
MDDKSVEFLKSVVGNDLDRDLLDILSDQKLSFDEQVEALLKKMEETQ